MKLYTGPFSMYSMKVEIALHEKGIDFGMVDVPFSFTEFYSPRHAEVLRVNPYKKQVPVLIDGDAELCDSTLICEYLEDIAPEPALWPRERAMLARARMLEMQSDEVFYPNIMARFMPRVSTEDHERAAAAKANIIAYYREMDAQLGEREYLASSFSYADIAFFTAQYFAETMNAPVPADCARLSAWRDRMRARPAIGTIVARVDAYFASQVALMKRQA